jgi:hypothetical protein
MAMQVTIPAALAEVSQGRDLIQTAEFAKAACKASQTIRKNYCLTGTAYGIRPVKIGNRLLWPVADIARLLNGEAA